MNVLSLFDGISCGYEALKRANIKIDKYFASEIDKYAIQVAMKNHPDILQLGDVKGLDTATLPKIDLLIGGSPCQDLSIAKQNRKGLDGERSGLFWEYVRILEEVKPKYFLLENVASMSKEDKAIITEALGVEPILINSFLVSAQNRRRFYWTNILNVTQPENKHIQLRDVLEPKIDEKYYIKLKSNTVRSSGRGSGINDRHNWDSIRLYDDSIVPKPIGEVRKFTLLECERLQTLPDGYTDVGISNTQRYKCIGNAWTVDVIAHIFSFIK